MSTNSSIFIFCGILALSWLQPMHLMPWVSFHSEVLAFLAVFVGVTHYFFITKLKQEVKLPLSAIFILLFMLIVIAQFFLGQIYYFGDLAVYLLYLAAAIFALLLGFNCECTDDVLATFSGIVLVAGSATAIVLLLQTFGANVDSQYVNPMPQPRRPGGNMGQPNHAATLIVMAIASTFYLRMLKSISFGVASFLLWFLVFGLAITESRAGLVSFLILTACMAVKSWRSKEQSSVRLIVSIVCVQQLFWWFWPLVLAWFWVSGGDGPGLANRILAATGDLRLVMWSEILNAIILKPWVGWGAGQLPKALNAVVDNFTISAPFTYPHNVILDVAIGFGIPVAVLFCMGIIYFGVCCYRCMDVPHVFWGGCLLLPIGIHSLFEFPYAYAYFWIPIFFLWGLIQRQFEQTTVFLLKSHVIEVIICFSCTLALWIGYEYVVLEEDFRVARFESMRIGSTAPSYVPPSAIVLTQLKNMALVARIRPSPKMDKKVILQLKEIAQKYPSTGFQSRYALALALNEDAEESLRQLKIIRAMHGEKSYSDLEGSWRELAAKNYPQLLYVIEKSF